MKIGPSHWRRPDSQKDSFVHDEARRASFVFCSRETGLPPLRSLAKRLLADLDADGDVGSSDSKSASCRSSMVISPSTLQSSSRKSATRRERAASSTTANWSRRRAGCMLSSAAPAVAEVVVAVEVVVVVGAASGGTIHCKTARKLSQDSRMSLREGEGVQEKSGEVGGRGRGRVGEIGSRKARGRPRGVQCMHACKHVYRSEAEAS